MTIDVANNNVRVEKSYWFKARGAATICDIDVVFTDIDCEKATNIPIEFFSHELLDCDADNETEVINFSKTWGLLYHPLRFCDQNTLDVLLDDGKIRDDYETAVNTSRLAEREIYQSRDMIEKFFDVVSIEESKLALKFMQMQTETLYACLEDTASFRDRFLAETINSVSRTQDCFLAFGNHDVSSGITPGEAAFFSGFHLINAVANQVIETIADEAPWKTCAWCGRPFKKKQSIGTKTNRRKSISNLTSNYCCEKCNGAMKDYRHGKRTTPPAWWTPEKAEANRSKGKRLN